MTFGKSRYNKKYEYEIIRLATLINNVVIGGCSKLFKHFINKYKPSSVISYSDRRWFGEATVYKTLGFTLLRTASPNYFYTKDYILLESRVKYQKHKLKKFLNFSNDLTEFENMKNNGYDMIWDCGNDVWVWQNKVKV